MRIEEEGPAFDIMGACGSSSLSTPDLVELSLSSIGRMKEVAPMTAGDEQRRNLRGRDLQRLRAFAAFSPAIALWELATNPLCDKVDSTSVDQRNLAPEVKAMRRLSALEPNCWTFDTALLFVDISGFTNLCTRLEVDALQRCINNYLTKIIDVVVEHGGDVLRFAGDALMCSWSLKDSDENGDEIQCV